MRDAIAGGSFEPRSDGAPGCTSSPARQWTASTTAVSRARGPAAPSSSLRGRPGCRPFVTRRPGCDLDADDRRRHRRGQRALLRPPRRAAIGLDDLVRRRRRGRPRSRRRRLPETRSIAVSPVRPARLRQRSPLRRRTSDRRRSPARATMATRRVAHRVTDHGLTHQRPPPGSADQDPPTAGSPPRSNAA